MKVRGITAMYFSGTGKTKMMTMDVAGVLACRLGVAVRFIDFSVPAAREEVYEFAEDEVLVIGVPVYAGRVPNLLLPFLKNNIRGAASGSAEGACTAGAKSVLGTPCIPVVTFGNRSYDNALIELRNIMATNGFACIGAGAFAAQHSFSQVLGAGRPDKADFDMAEKLVLSFADRLEQIDESAVTVKDEGCEAGYRTLMAGDIEIPVPVKGDATAGYYQPRDREGNSIDIRKVKPKTSDACTKCGKCAAICPMGAIDHTDFSSVTGICVKCCACERFCPAGAKYFDNPGYIYHKEELEAMYAGIRAESEIF